MDVRDEHPLALELWLAAHRDGTKPVRLAAFGGQAGEELDPPAARGAEPERPEGTAASHNACAADDSWLGLDTLAVGDGDALVAWELEHGIAVIRDGLIRDGLGTKARAAILEAAVLELARRHGTVGGWVAEDNADAKAALEAFGGGPTARESLSPFEFWTYPPPPASD